MLLISLVFCGLLLFAVNGAARAGGLGGAAGITIAGLVLLFFCGTVVFLPSAFLSAILILLATGLCAMAKGGSRMFLKCSLGAVLLSHLIVGLVWLPEMLQLKDARDRYPIESMEQRLAYQTHRAVKSSNASLTHIDDLPAGQAMDALEKQIEDSREGSRREFSLHLLHKSTVEDFMNSPGFGVSRAPQPRAQDIELPAIETIPFPAPDYVPDTGLAGEASKPSAQYAAPSLPAREDLGRMHREGVADFINPQGFGYIQDRDHVRGFQPHHFRTYPELSRAPERTERWVVQNLELVSLLTHDEPVAYLSKNLPRMDELRAAATRPLDSFEKEALGTLQKGEDLKLNVAADQIRMLGAVRAVKQCLKCHGVERGELLGAFSYTLRRARSDP